MERIQLCEECEGPLYQLPSPNHTGSDAIIECPHHIYDTTPPTLHVSGLQYLGGNFPLCLGCRG